MPPLTRMQYLRQSLLKEGLLLKEREMTPVKGIFFTDYKLIK
jgi:hypothetical protein